MFHVKQFKLKIENLKLKHKDMNTELLLANLRSIPDFPIPGILFRDVTTLFKSPECL